MVLSSSVDGGRARDPCRGPCHDTTDPRGSGRRDNVRGWALDDNDRDFVNGRGGVCRDAMSVPWSALVRANAKSAVVPCGSATSSRCLAVCLVAS